MAQELHIFDFDGTLFRSPCPHPRLGEAFIRDQLIVPPFLGGLGWFQDAATLSPPFVPVNPGDDMDTWFVESVVVAFRDALIKGHYVVVLTGRDEPFRDRVTAILASAGLVPHELHLKGGERLGTIKFKSKVFADLAARMRPRRVVLYEDRPEQGAALCARMRDVLAKYARAARVGVPVFNYVLVDAADSKHFLPREQEEHLLAVLAANRDAEQKR